MSINIAFVVPSLKAGGLERVASLLSNKWGSTKHVIVHLITLDTKPSFYPIIESVNLIQPPRNIDQIGRWRKIMKLFFWLRTSVTKINPDIVLSFGEGYNSFVIFSLNTLNLPIFVSNRTTPITSLKGIRGIVNPIFYKFTSGVILQTFKSQQLLSQKYRDVRFKVIPNPVEINVSKIQCDKDGLLNVGSFTGAKNQIELVRIFHSISSSYPSWKLHFAGDGAKILEVKNEAARLKIQNQVSFHGIVEDLDTFYSEGSVFAFTSLLEGFPNALGEAMARGCACIAYDCITGPSELIDDGRNGFLVPMGDHVQYKARLQQLMEDTNLRYKFGKAAREKMKQFSIDKIAQQFLDFMLDEND